MANHVRDISYIFLLKRHGIYTSDILFYMEVQNFELINICLFIIDRFINNISTTIFKDFIESSYIIFLV